MQIELGVYFNRIAATTNPTRKTRATAVYRKSWALQKVFEFFHFLYMIPFSWEKSYTFIPQKSFLDNDLLFFLRWKWYLLFREKSDLYIRYLPESRENSVFPRKFVIESLCSKQFHSMSIMRAIKKRRLFFIFFHGIPFIPFGK